MWALLLLVAGIGLAALAAAPAVAAEGGALPRGIRNRNPGNIRTRGTRNGLGGADPWRGLIAEDEAGYGVFDSAANGIRAMGRVLATYRERHGLNTVAAIIHRWAPPSENDTAAYVRHVAARLDVAPDHPLTDAQIPALVEAIILHENGVQPYSRGQIEAALAA